MPKKQPTRKTVVTIKHNEDKHKNILAAEFQPFLNIKKKRDLCALSISDEIVGTDDKTIALVRCRNSWAILLWLNRYFGRCKIGLGLME
jgi:predicted protein tyrosine phosphatase